MDALVYIVRKSVKNSLLELIKKPGKLILYAVFVALIVVAFAASTFGDSGSRSPAPFFWFSGALFAFVGMFFVITLANGLSGGDAIFNMNDVNLLFVSPLNPRRILLYGIVNMTKTAFAGSFFILFQGGTLSYFGIDYVGVILTFVCFFVSVVVLTTVSLLIYCSTNGRPARKLFVKLAAILLAAPLAAYFAVQYFSTADIAAALESTVNSPFLTLFPVAGWTATAVTAFLSGNVATGAAFMGLNAALCVGVLAYVTLTNPDFYEDVLVASETAYEKKRAIAEGNISATAGKRRIRVTSTGIPGSGAAALFGKHTRESFRENRLGYITTFSAILIIGALILTSATRDLFTSLTVLTSIQILMIGTGRGLKETFSHYIYMIPEPSFKKMLWSNMEVIARTLIESAVIFGVGGAIIGANVLFILACVAAYTLFSYVLLGVNYLSMRFSGADISMGILIMLYYLEVMVIMAPGVAAAIFAGTAVGGDFAMPVGLLVASLWELIAGSVCFALSKGVLHNCDMAMMKTNK